MKLQRPSITASITTFVLIVFALLYLVFWSVYKDYYKSMTYEGGRWASWRAIDLMNNCLEGIYWDHSLQLMDVDSRYTSGNDDSSWMTNTSKLPGILDAFYLDFANRSGESLNKLIPTDTLLLQLDKRKVKPYRTKRAKYRLVGAQVKFGDCVYAGTEQMVLIRYIGSIDPSQSTKAVGYVLDERWRERKVVEVLDSLFTHSAFGGFAPLVPDSNPKVAPESDDPYACANGDWKQTLGVMQGKDTLWWEGDPQADIFSTKFEGNYFMQSSDRKIGAKMEFIKSTNRMEKGFNRISYILLFVGLLCVAVAAILVIIVSLMRKKFRRNQIALAHLAHGIKTPIARIRLNVDSLTKEMVASPEEEREIIEAIDRECGRLERSITGAAMSLEAGKRTVTLKEGDLTALLATIADGWQPGFAQAGVRLVYNTPSAPIHTLFDDEQLRIALDNLIDNALRHTRLNLEKHPDGRVEIGLSQTDGKIEITVDDTGAGIPKKDRRRIFARFQRATGSAGTGASGLGLGLALVREIAVAHKGTVKIEDSKLGGARFVIQI